MPSRRYEQQQVRQRDRFLCQYCGKAGEQYAHIIADTDGGQYTLNNLVLLCYEHHTHWLESAKASAGMKARLIEIARKLRDKPKQDGLLSQLFAWPADEHIVVVIGGGFRFVDQENILESAAHPERPYLKLGIDSIGVLRINAFFEDAQGNEFMSITDNKLEVETIAAWDITVNRRSFSLTHTDRKIKLNMHQEDNLELWLTGNLYLNGGYFQITDKYIFDVACDGRMSGNISINGKGLMLAPGTVMF
jgi:hypothetical protein